MKIKPFNKAYTALIHKKCVDKIKLARPSVHKKAISKALLSVVGKWKKFRPNTLDATVLCWSA